MKTDNQTDVFTKKAIKLLNITGDLLLIALSVIGAISIIMQLMNMSNFEDNLFYLAMYATIYTVVIFILYSLIKWANAVLINLYEIRNKK